METQLEVRCSHCGELVRLRLGCAAPVLRRAIMLQSQRLGTQLHCTACGARFVLSDFHRDHHQPLRD